MEVIFTLFIVVAGIIFFGWMFTIFSIGAAVLNPKRSDRNESESRHDHAGGFASSAHTNIPPVGLDPASPTYASQNSDHTDIHSHHDAPDMGSSHHSTHDSGAHNPHSIGYDAASSASIGADLGSAISYSDTSSPSSFSTDTSSSASSFSGDSGGSSYSG